MFWSSLRLSVSAVKNLMDLEFDKEMDAILRKARDSGATAVRPVDSPHVDADAIAAFAENALPTKARDMYVRHFADCDRCRQMLSATISSTVDPAAEVSPVEAAAAVSVLPWYERLLHPTTLAVALGELVLAFTGIIGYMAIQSQRTASRIDVAQVKESAPRVSSPSAAANTVSNTANSNASAGIMTNSEIANSESEAALPANTPTTRSNGPSNGSSDVAPPAESKRDENRAAAETTDMAAVPAAPPPPVAGQPAPVASARVPEPAKLKDEDKADAPAKSNAAAGDRNDAALSSNATSKRASGPRNMTQVQQQQERVVTSERANENNARRKVGGKTFDRRDGAWYDSAYNGSPTKNYRRGTDEYKKLDAGLRSIADSFRETVVIVWKQKAYRIQ